MRSLAPYLTKPQVITLLPIINEAASTSINFFEPQEYALDLLAALLRRISRLDFTESELLSIRHSTWKAIAWPHLSGKEDLWQLYGPA